LNFLSAGGLVLSGGLLEKQFIESAGETFSRFHVNILPASKQAHLTQKTIRLSELF